MASSRRRQSPGFTFIHSLESLTFICVSTVPEYGRKRSFLHLVPSNLNPPSPAADKQSLNELNKWTWIALYLCWRPVCSCCYHVRKGKREFTMWGSSRTRGIIHPVERICSAANWSKRMSKFFWNAVNWYGIDVDIEILNVKTHSYAVDMTHILKCSQGWKHSNRSNHRIQL